MGCFVVRLKSGHESREIRSRPATARKHPGGGRRGDGNGWRVSSQTAGRIKCVKTNTSTKDRDIILAKCLSQVCGYFRTSVK